jgi:GT2 family glycosyltransferase
MLDAGYDIIYIPSARVIHAPDPSGRSRSKYVRYAIRNDCLFALYNEPLPLALLTVPIRLGRYLSMSRGVDDRGGFTWIVRELVKQLPAVAGGRRPVSWNTVRQWRRVGRTWPAFPLVRTHA